MGNPVCVDSDILIDHLRGRKPDAALYERIITEEIPFTTYITKFELLCGIRSPKEDLILREALLLFTILPFDEKSSAEAAKIYRELSVKGELIGIRDIMIAGTARAHGIQLASRNLREFERIAGLKLWAA